MDRSTRSHRITVIIGRALNAAVMAAVLVATTGLPPIAGPSSAAHAACAAGSDRCPLWLNLHPGSAGVTVSERLTPDRNRYSFAFSARAGQKLTWAFAGRHPSVRTLLRYPTGDNEGPSLPDIIPLSTSGTYVFTVSSNTMAEDIYGPFELTLHIN